jgi:hypothetical protein
MTEDQYLNILISSESIFEQAATLACELRNNVLVYNKSQTGDETLDIVTEADIQVQEFILSRLVETPLIECELIAEESSPSVSKFKGTNGLVLTIDPIDGTAMYVAGQGFFSVIVGLHNKKDILYSYYRYPFLNWTKRIVKNHVEDIGDIPDVKVKSGIDSMSKIAYLAHVKPDNLPKDIEDEFELRGLTVCDRKDISDESTMTALLYTEKIAGVCVLNPIAYDCLGVLYYARATGVYEIYSTVDLSRPMKGSYGVYYPGLYIIWKSNK